MTFPGTKSYESFIYSMDFHTGDIKQHSQQYSWNK